MPKNKCHCGEARFTKFSEDEEKCIFHCEKKEGEWFTENSEGSKKWNEEFVNEFHEEIFKNRNNIFEGFIIPALALDPFNIGVLTKFLFKSREIHIFKNCKFLGVCNFDFFSKEKIKTLVFESCDFFDDFCIIPSLENIQFEMFFLKTRFHRQAKFSSAKFSEEKQTLFDDIKSKEGLGFYNINFPESVKFKDCDLSKTSFLGSNIEKVNFENCEWREEKKTGRNVLYDEYLSKHKYSIKTLLRTINDDFKELLTNKIIQFFTKVKSIFFIFWNDHSILRKIWDFIQIIIILFIWTPVVFGAFVGLFYALYFTTISIHTHIYVISLSIIAISFIKIYISPTWKKRKKEYASIETLYRQLKKNFEEKKDFENADSFFSGEMDMKLKKHFFNISSVNVWNFIFLFLYKKISNFNFSPIFAIKWIIRTILFFSVFFILSSQKEYDINFLVSLLLAIIGTFFPFIWSFVFFLLLIFNIFEIKNPNIQNFEEGRTILVDAIHYSFVNAVPIIKIPEGLNSYAVGIQLPLRYLENIISTGIWALLIISLHRKFKR